MARILGGFEICIVGGGPSGLAAAIALAQEGHRVAVIDCASPPIDKACGEGLLPDSVAALTELGITIPAEAGFPFQGIRFCDSETSMAADFPGHPGIGLRRIVLHELLRSRAEQLGVLLHWGAKHVMLTNAGLSVSGELLKAKFVIGADGQNSHIRRQAGLNQVSSELRRYGYRRHHRIRPWSSYMELYWGSKCQIYTTPVSTDEVCVAMISRHPGIRLDAALTEFPALRRRLASAPQVSPEKGGLSVCRVLRRIHSDGLALIGDASGSVDAITGEGIGLSFRQAVALTQALKVGRLDQYKKEHRSLSRRPQAMARLLLTLDRYPGLRRRVLTRLERRQKVFDSLLALHVGESSVRDLCSWRLLDFGLALIAA
jgi:flavin-dependent dehydrogenase